MLVTTVAFSIAILYRAIMCVLKLAYQNEGELNPIEEIET